MSTLETIQKAFKSYLLSARNQSILPFIAPAHPFSAEKRLTIYHYGYRARLIEALGYDFPKCKTLLGEDKFQEVALEYLARHPSEHYSVRYFGKNFIHFLKKNKTDFPPILIEMAIFEWTTHFTLDASDAPCLTAHDLSLINAHQWPELIFKFHPSVSLNYFNWDTVEVWKEIDNEALPRQAVKYPHQTCWIFWRQDLKCYFASLDEIQTVIAELIFKAYPFAEICGHLTDYCDQEAVPLNMMKALSGWINNGMMIKF